MSDLHREDVQSEQGSRKAVDNISMGVSYSLSLLTPPHT